VILGLDLLVVWALLRTGAWGSWRSKPIPVGKDDLEEDTIYG